MPWAKKKGRGYIAPGRRDVYEALRRQGKSKKQAAKIANAGISKAARKKMAKKAARTRKARGR
jgi:uncharacterized protein (DUF302 family)